MGALELLLTSVALSMDAVAVALSCGMTAKKMTPWQMVRVALAFGLFQALMPALGFLAGSSVHKYIAAADHWVAFFLLAFIGGRMVYEQWKEWHAEVCEIKDMTRLSNLLLMALATSIDALAVGIGLAMTQVNLLLSVACIGLVTFLLSIIAIFVGRRVSGAFSKYAGLLGGLILIGIGLRILIDHLGGNG